MNADHDRFDSWDEFRTKLAAWENAPDSRPPDLAPKLLELACTLLAESNPAVQDPETWHRYLDCTRHPTFLQQLPDRDARYRWADTTFSAIERSAYSLETMMDQRVASHPERILFRDLGHGTGSVWSYLQVARKVKAIAATLLGDRVTDGPGAGPRVALVCDNSIGSACCDLACLFHGIFVTPLNTHFNTGTLAWICQQAEIDTVITDSQERLQRLAEISPVAGRELRLLLINCDPDPHGPDCAILDAECTRISPSEVQQRLQRHGRFGLHEPATAMFTSGSTGQPKGVVFSLYNLVTKRFARAAALPQVGDDEVLLCYLPLFHTFGRYLELLGTIFWGGSYVFSGNPSAETLLAQFQQVNPTALISIPLRWVQIRDRVNELSTETESETERQEVFRQVVGKRLYWGLSAAGYLDPKVFNFFHRHGVDLCSGFGMTEATGGITMTPPGDYQPNSVGIPLPGIRTRFSKEGELQISGPYIARYLGSDQPSFTEDFWLATGDLFEVREDGHHEIVDRIKDIYKNNRGQTIAPRKVEQKFSEVPGIKRAFLAGDGRAYNTLLIVPDCEDSFLVSLGSESETREYFHQIVTTANRDLASFERVINFAVLDRDFDAERGELTPKGSYRRKAIEKNFATVIQELYQSNVVRFDWRRYQIRVPRWFFRDLGILETDISVQQQGLYNRQNQLKLLLQEDARANRLQIGDLQYQLTGTVIDLGTICRQPLLWAGNPALTAFCPCKVGWDIALDTISEQVLLPDRAETYLATADQPPITQQNLALVTLLCQEALFGDLQRSLAAVRQLEKMLHEVDSRLGNLIRRRLEALANHPEVSIRCLAYSILVLEEPVPDYNRFLPAFVESGRTFLSEESIAAIASSNIEPRRLQAFRQRLHTYRKQLPWPATTQTRQVFNDLFQLLSVFARYQPEYYAPVREELVSWVLHDSDPELAASAERYFQELATWFESSLSRHTGDTDTANWSGRIVYQEGLTEKEIDRLNEVFVGTTFLKETVMLACDGESFFIKDVGPGGIWVSRILTWYEYSRYRVSINTLKDKHFDVQLIIREDLDQVQVLKTIYWLIAIYGYPHGSPVLPRFGCCRPELGAISLAYTSDLTVWEKIREFSSVRGPGTSLPSRSAWRKLFVLAMSTVFAGWANSGRRIVPGAVSPTNVVVPEPDFREGHHITSLTGWRPYAGPLSLVGPLVRNFYLQTASHYPWCRNYLELEWICEACTEAIGVQDTIVFLAELQRVLNDQALPQVGRELKAVVNAYRDRLRARPYLPLALQSAIERYRAWERVSGKTTAQARVQTCEELSRLYRLDRHGEIVRYTLYRHTYFAKTAPTTLEIFDRLLTRMFSHPGHRATELVELSDLQAVLDDPDDRLAFRRLAFPRAKPAHKLEVLAVGDRGKGQVIVRSKITDKQGGSLTVYEPTAPAEVGMVYRLFLLAGFPKTISERDCFFVAKNLDEQIIGGICYQVVSEAVVHLDGIVVARTFLNRGITSALLEDFCARMAERGFQVVKTHFFLRAFYQRRGFHTDQRWGGLVRYLMP